VQRPEARGAGLGQLLGRGRKEEHRNISKAITREKQIKKWKREWKIKLIEEFNAERRDLYFDLIG
jgi:predicted GIY-YIG superfamily endonuclease